MKRLVHALNPPKGSGPLDVTGKIISNPRDPDNEPPMGTKHRRVLVPYTDEEMRSSKMFKAHVQIMRK